jgi:hypothetical protein
MTALRKSAPALTAATAPFAIRSERASDIATREGLLDGASGLIVPTGAAIARRTAKPRLRSSHTA